LTYSYKVVEYAPNMSYPQNPSPEIISSTTVGQTARIPLGSTGSLRGFNGRSELPEGPTEIIERGKTNKSIAVAQQEFFDCFSEILEKAA